MDVPGRSRLIRQPSSRTGENPPYGMIGGIEETSASFEARSAPRSHPTKAPFRGNAAIGRFRVKSRCGAVAVGPTYLFPPLSSGGALVVRPWLRFHIPLIEPDMQISRIRLSDKTSRHCFCVRRHLQLSNTSRS